MYRNFLIKRFFAYRKALQSVGIYTNRNVIFNPSVAEIYQIAFKNQPPSDPHTYESRVALNGSLCSYSGLKTGRQPLNSRLVKDAQTQKNVDWSSKYNIPIDQSQFNLIKSIAVDYINHKGKILVIDGYAGWDPQFRIKVRTICTRTYHALFMKNMLIQPTIKQIEQDFIAGADINILNAGEMFVSKNIPGINSNMVTALNLSQKQLVILGTQFAGEMKKSLFKILNYYYPRKGILTLHSSATVNPDNTSTIMCGLSATGKTALALRSHKRKLIGDDEICWGDKGIFNIQGGCYAKILNLEQNMEPQIFNAIRFGSVVENASFYQKTRKINFFDTTITPNARTAFPLSYVPNTHLPAVGPHPTNIIFLTCDTTGVLPPVARLTYEQAIYQFLTGYTAKIGGSDISAKVAQPTFSSCFGQITLPLHPSLLAKMLYEKIKKHNCNVWIVNTGWTQGRYGSGKRIDFQHSLKIVDAINDGTLAQIPTHKFKMFNFAVPNQCPGIPSNLFHPEQGWHSKVEYQETLSSLVIQFQNNYEKKFKGSLGNLSELIDTAGPVLI